MVLFRPSALPRKRVVLFPWVKHRILEGRLQLQPLPRGALASGSNSPLHRLRGPGQIPSTFPNHKIKGSLKQGFPILKTWKPIQSAKNLGLGCRLQDGYPWHHGPTVSNNLVCGLLVTPSPTYRRAKSSMCYGNQSRQSRGPPTWPLQDPGAS